MKRLSIVMAAIVAASLVGVQDVDAQDMPLEFEGRLGAAIPMGDAPADLTAGLSFGASIGYGVTPLISIFGGYTQNNFGTDQGSFSTGGFDLGARVNLATPFIDPWLRGGVVFHRIEETDRAVPILPDGRTGDYSLGFELGAGLGFRMGEMITLTPGVRYTTFRPDERNASSDALVADVGVRVGL